MALKFPNILLLILALVAASYSESILLKIRDYPFKFGKVGGLSYPEFIDIEQNANLTIKLSVYNMTSEKLAFQPYTFVRNFVGSTCQYVVETVDYGYYTKFPFYRLIAECTNQTHTQVINLKIYRSGDFEQIVGNIVAKNADELNCEAGPLKVQYFYSSIGTTGTFVYKLCLKKTPNTQSLYKEYIPDSKSSYTFKQDSIEKVVGLTNLSLVDIQLAVGPDGKYNIYLSQTYGIIANGGSKFVQNMWKPVEKVYKIQRLCWSNTFVVLTQGFIYYINITFNPNQTIVFSNLIKTEKINVENSTSRCNFFAIGRYAVCSLYDEDANETTWIIYSDNNKTIKGNVTEVMKGKVERPYLSEDLCSTNSFYLNSSRYQFYFPSPPSTPHGKSLHSYKLPTLNGTLLCFMDTGQQLSVVTAIYYSTSIQYLGMTGYNKNSFNLNPISITTLTVTPNITNVRIEQEKGPNTSYNVTLISVIYNDLVNGAFKTNSFMYYVTGTQYTTQGKLVGDVAFDELGYFKYGGYLYNYRLAVKTPIEKNTFGTYNYANMLNFQIRYPYEFEAIGFRPCSMTTPDNQMLMIRQDPNELVVMRVSLRNGNYLILDDVRQFGQYKGYRAQCAHDGLFIYSQEKGKIVVLDSDLQVRYTVDQDFEDLKFTKTLLLTKNGPFVEVRLQSNGDLININKWNMEDIVTNIHSNGFIHKAQVKYYQFGNDNGWEAENLRENQVEVTEK